MDVCGHLSGHRTPPQVQAPFTALRPAAARVCEVGSCFTGLQALGRFYLYGPCGSGKWSVAPKPRFSWKCSQGPELPAAAGTETFTALPGEVLFGNEDTATVPRYWSHDLLLGRCCRFYVAINFIYFYLFTYLFFTITGNAWPCLCRRWGFSVSRERAFAVRVNGTL